ncbi:MAG: iron ABC transporter permease, partial [Roseburia sp.]|nr:iron ABC transporter permease [Roseburia sp.]
MNVTQNWNVARKKNLFERGIYINFLLLFLLVIVFFVGCNVGQYRMGVSEVIAALFGGGSASARLALFQYRLPRLCLAILVGLGMGMSGVVMQDLLHNDLASPGTLGVSAGSGLFVTVYVALFRTRSGNAILMPVLALAGGLLSAGLIFLLGIKRKQRIQPTRLIMTGVAMSSAYGAVSTFMMYILDENQLEFLQRWQSGELWGTQWKYIIVFAIWLAVFGFLTYRQGHTLNVINIGYDIARGLGVNVGARFVGMSVCAVALSSAAVAFGGNFFFLGLIGPHIARRLVGSDARVLLPASGMIAGMIVLIADMVVQGFDVFANIP